MRSLIVLIARRGTGISENRRKLYAVGFGMMSPGGPYELKMEGKGKVRRLFSAFPKEAAPIRRIAPRNVSLIFMMISLYPKSRTKKPRQGGASSNSSFRVILSPAKRPYPS
jgi:hypothetical protein